MKKRLSIAILCAAVLAVAACGGHGGSLPPQSAMSGKSGGYGTFAWGVEQMSGATYQGPANLGWMRVSAMVRPQNADALLQYAAMVNDPGSPLYRHFITPQTIGQMYGASTADYQAAANYFRGQGLTVAGWPQHLMLYVQGPQANMERAFGTRFGTFSKNGVTFVAPRSAPSFNAPVPVVAVGNLVSYVRLQRHFIVPPRANSNFDLGYSPQQVRAAFDYVGAYTAPSPGPYDGTGVTVGIIGTGPINVNAGRNSTNVWCGDADVQALAALYNVAVSASHVCEVNVVASDVAAGLQRSGIPTAAPATPNASSYPSPNPSYFPYSSAFASPPPVTGPNGANGTTDCNGEVALSSFGTPHSPNCNPEDLEAQLDSQQVATLAPGSNVEFYLAYNASDCSVYFPNQCVAAPPTPIGSPSPGAPASPTPQPNLGYPASGLVESDPELQEAIARNTSDVLSVSYGGGETDGVGFYYDANGHGFDPLTFAALAAEGIAVFVSSGDNGVTSCNDPTQPCVNYPASDPNVTAVGGVNAPINEVGQLVGNVTAWGVTNGGNGGSQQLGTGTWGGSGGGRSTVFAAPSWQASALGVTTRQVPDIALLADTDTGVTVTTNDGLAGTPASIYPVGGTSVAAPQAAAMWALVIEACKKSATCTAGGSGSNPYRLGNAAPYFYSIFKGTNLTARASFTPHLPYAQVFYDVVYGENAMYSGSTFVPGFAAGPGYDLVTGLGVPFGGHLVQGVTGAPAP